MGEVLIQEKLIKDELPATDMQGFADLEDGVLMALGLSSGRWKVKKTGIEFVVSNFVIAFPGRAYAYGRSKGAEVETGQSFDKGPPSDANPLQNTLKT